MKILVVIPCLNEEAHLPALLDQIRADPAAGRIIVVDGGSTDSSAAIVRACAAQDERVVLQVNPKRIQSAGVNLAVAHYGDDAEVFVRVDAHAAYPAHFLSRLLAAYEESGADSVTVSMRAVAQDGACFQRAAACAQNSVLGAGGSLHRKQGVRRWVDHGHHALFKSSAFRKAGGYDESYAHNEDAEFDLRLSKNSGKVLLAGDIVIDYFPRATAPGLARQYFNYGKGRARTAGKHNAPLKLRQLAPVLVAPAMALSLAAPFAILSAAPLAIWLGLCLGYGLVLGVRARNLCASGAGIAAALMHLAWSTGFLVQTARQMNIRPALVSAS
jgi:succinoglycan biosynthesis protein ExoA